MDDKPSQPPEPWIEFPDLARTSRPSSAAKSKFIAWFEFLIQLSPEELAEYQRRHPAPDEWNEFYALATRLTAAARERHLSPVADWICSAAAKVWQTTTLK